MKLKSISEKSELDHCRPDNLTTPQQVAKQFKTDPRTIYRLCKEGRLPFIRINKLIRIRECDVQRFLELQMKSSR